MRVLGIDPGTKSWDFYGLDFNENDEKIILDASIPSKELVQNPQKAISLVKSVDNVDFMVAPSGFGLPLKEVRDLTENDMFLMLLKFENKYKDTLLGLEGVLRSIKSAGLSATIVPGVKHLSTVPEYRKINKIDMGTADKLCTAVVGIRDQMKREHLTPEQTNFIMVEIGYGFTAVLAVENGQVIDGIGGSNIMGFRACGSLDGELAYLIKNIEKKNIYKGGVAYIAGYADMGLKEITLLAEKDDQTRMALDAYISSVKKSVYAIASSFSNKNNISEVLLAGRGAEIPYLRDKIVSALKGIAPARLMESYSQIAKRAAQGAAFIANGLNGGVLKPITMNLKIQEASGSILDHIFIPFEKDRLTSDLD